MLCSNSICISINWENFSPFTLLANLQQRKLLLLSSLYFLAMVRQTKGLLLLKPHNIFCLQFLFCSVKLFLFQPDFPFSLQLFMAGFVPAVELAGALCEPTELTRQNSPSKVNKELKRASFVGLAAKGLVLSTAAQMRRNLVLTS